MHILRECDGDGYASVGVWGCVVAGCEYMGGTGFVSNADYMVEISAVRGVRGGVCEMCMCLTQGGEWVRGLGLGLNNPVGRGGV